MIYDDLCDHWKEFCGDLRSFADSELRQALEAMNRKPNDPTHKAWYEFAVTQKSELNKDINFYEIELDDLINRDEVDVFVECFKEIKQSVLGMYNGTTMSFRSNRNAERPPPSSKIPMRNTSATSTSRPASAGQIPTNRQRQDLRPSGIPTRPQSARERTHNADTGEFK